jgi:hypothetical protein
MMNQKSSIKFITNLHKLISEEEKKYDKSVNWIEKKGKKGFNILNLRKFHERCILNLITLSYDHRSLFRQLNNYGFKQIKEFWYHSENQFFKDSNNLKSIKRCCKKKIIKVNKAIQTTSIFTRKRKNYYNQKSEKKKVRKKNKNVQTDSYFSNYDIIRHTQDFLANEEFNNINFDYIQEDSSCFNFLTGL